MKGGNHMTEMKALKRDVLKSLPGSQSAGDHPIKALQIGDGNFIRSFIDWMISAMNQKTDFNGSIATVQALPGDQTTQKINKQEGLFTLFLKGIRNGQSIEERHIIDSITKGFNPYTEWESLLKLVEEEQVSFLFSNTTEAGIVYHPEEFNPDQSPVSYPGKVTALLYHRYQTFKGDREKGWTIIPCELIDNNGEVLRHICIRKAMDWRLPTEFIDWIDSACTFCNTLVDRIVPGFPANEAEQIYKELQYRDELLAVAEPYHLFVIEGPSKLETELPLKQAGLNVHFDSIKSYRELKVKLLNGAHTMLAPIGILSGLETVREGMQNQNLFQFIDHALHEEVAITMDPLAKNASVNYIEQLYERFTNPYLHHKLIDISLNGYSKFKSRVWPSLYAYLKEYELLPKRLIFSFASLLYFYKGVNEKVGYSITDDEQTIEMFKRFYHSNDHLKEQLVVFIKRVIEEDFLEKEEELNELYEAIATDFMLIDQLGMQSALEKKRVGQSNENNSMY